MPVTHSVDSINDPSPRNQHITNHGEGSQVIPVPGHIKVTPQQTRGMALLTSLPIKPPKMVKKGQVVVQEALGSNTSIEEIMRMCAQVYYAQHKTHCTETIPKATGRHALSTQKNGKAGLPLQ